MRCLLLRPASLSYGIRSRLPEQVYGKSDLQVIVGEWSLATNLDAAMDLSKAEVRS